MRGIFTSMSSDCKIVPQLEIEYEFSYSIGNYFQMVLAYYK